MYVYNLEQWHILYKYACMYILVNIFVSRRLKRGSMAIQRKEKVQPKY